MSSLRFESADSINPERNYQKRKKIVPFTFENKEAKVREVINFINEARVNFYEVRYNGETVVDVLFIGFYSFIACFVMINTWEILS